MSGLKIFKLLKEDEDKIIAIDILGDDAAPESVVTALAVFFPGATSVYATCGNLIDATSDSITEFSVTGNAREIMKSDTKMQIKILNGNPTGVTAGGAVVLYITYKIITL